MEYNRTEQHRMEKLESQNVALTRELDQIRRQRNSLALNASETARQLQTSLDQCRHDASLVVHALNCAVQLIEVLIAFMPEGSPLHPEVAVAKDALDRAMQAITGRTIRK